MAFTLMERPAVHDGLALVEAVWVRGDGKAGWACLFF